MEQKILSLKDDKINSEVELFEYPSGLSEGRNLFSYSIMKKGYIYPDSNDRIIQYKNFHYTPEFISTNDYKYVTYTVYDYGNCEERGYSISFYDAEKKSIQQEYNWATEINVPVTIKLKEGVQYFRFTIVNTGIKAKLELGNKSTDWTPAPEDLNLSYPDFITEFKPSISDRYILTEELIEYPEELRGGRNLYIESKNLSTYRKGSDHGNTTGHSIVIENEEEVSKIKPINNGNFYWYPKLNSSSFTIKKDEIYTISFDFKTSQKSNTGMYFYLFAAGVSHTIIPNTEWVRVSKTYKVVADKTVTNSSQLMGFSTLINNTETYIKNIKLEKGSTPTPWTPAPEDLGLSYPNWVTEFKPSISENGILIGSFTENPNI